jgi:hypothetical protein
MLPYQIKHNLGFDDPMEDSLLRRIQIDYADEYNVNKTCLFATFLLGVGVTLYYFA